jgi:S-adenosylmethionine:tRNA-ribosyltransferase-isomerase (queuine synthetase)
MKEYAVMNVGIMCFQNNLWEGVNAHHMHTRELNIKEKVVA